MVGATTGEPEVRFALAGQEVRVGAVPLEPIDVYFSASGSPIIDVATAFADRGALPMYPWRGIAIDTFVYNVAEDIGRHRGAPLPKAAEQESRMTEMRWLGSQRELCVRLAGQWIAVEGERLIAHGQRLIEVLEEARSKGVEHPFVVCLPESHEEEIAVIA
ncbi:MAG: DUF5678 domain-containing protein [Dehalococcoidia bacterium]